MSETINPHTTDISSASSGTAITSVEVPSYLPKQTLGQLLRNDLGFLPVLLTLVIIAIFFAITTNGVFLTPGNLSNLVLQTATIGIDGVAAALVLLLGEIDLSIAAVGTFGAVVMGILSARAGAPAWEAIVIGILAGLAAGLLNGVLIAIIRIPSFIVTLAASIAYAGLIEQLLNNQASLPLIDPAVLALATNYLPEVLGIGLPTLVLIIYIVVTVLDYMQRGRAGLRRMPLWQLVLRLVIIAVVVEGVVALLENAPGPTPGTYLGVPNSGAILVGLMLIFWLILTKTTFGRHVYAVGGNAEAARRAGINVTAIRIAIFTLCSTLAAIGGIVDASRSNAVASAISPNLLLDAIAAAVIGGVSLFGGRGSVWSVILGALILTSLENGLALLNQPAAVQLIVEGIVLVLAVMVDAFIRRAQARSGR
jgi:D-xylose transport system permease protein